MSIDFDAIQEWIDDDPDPATREELAALVEDAKEPGEAASAAVEQLRDRFSSTLQFGTAGLRGQLGAGPNRMNRAVVIKAAAGLAAFLHQTVGSDFTVVIGADARHGSADFARDTAAVITAAGGRALVLPPQQPTPLLAFAVGHLNADAGVMVTASHNPPRDNGYKVYLGARPQEAVYVAEASAEVSPTGTDPAGTDSGTAPAGTAPAGTDPHARALAGAGAQIVTPLDTWIARHIANVGSVADIPRADTGWGTVGDDVVRAYLDSITHVTARLGLPTQPASPPATTSGTEPITPVPTTPEPSTPEPSTLHIVHTSLHGVGNDLALAALHQAGFTNVTPVAQQAQPDPDFPTVTFPNPEEPGALDLAFATATEVGADLIIANDPDADRLSIAIPISGTPGAFRQLTGDEVGLLLGDFIAARTPGVVANSLVSSRALAQAATFHGVPCRTTLTGFKWITRGTDLVFGYEEALGYSVDPQVVRDKDGISAAVVFAHLVAQLRAAGRSVEDELRRIRVRDGIFLTQPLTLRVTNLARIDQVLTKLAAAPPESLGGATVAEVVDLSAGSATLPATPGFALLTESGDRVVIRPSGTEPKIKCYLEAVTTADSEDTYEPALQAAHATLDRMSADLDTYLQ